MLAPSRPDKTARVASTFLRWGASPATGVTTAAIKHPHEIAIIDERGALSWERLHRRSNALAHSFAEMGIGHGDGVGIMCRNHRGFVEATLAAAKLGASALYLNTMFAGPQLVEVTRREAPKALVYDEEFAELLRGRRRLRHPRRRLDRRGRAGGAPTLERLIASGDDADLQAAARQAALRDPHLGHDRHAEGRPALQPRRALHDRLAARQDPLPRRLDDGDRGAALPLLGLLPLRDEPADRLDDGAAPPLRPRADPGRGAAQPRRRARRGAGDGAADPRAAGGDAALATTSPRCGSRRSPARPCRASWRLEWMDRFGDSVYNLYGSTEVAYATIATPEDLRAAPGTAGKPPRGTEIRLYDEQGDGGSAGRGRADLRRQRHVLRGLHRRRQQGGDRRPALQRRRRPHRLRRPPLHRRPRRRDDRLRRRERLPARGRGPARRPRARRRGGGDRGRGRGVRAAPEGLRRVIEGAEVSAEQLGAHVKQNLAGYKVAARDRVPRRAAAQRHRQGPQARAARPASPPEPRAAANCGSRAAQPGLASAARSSLPWHERSSQAGAGGRRGDGDHARRRPPGAGVGAGVRAARRRGRAAQREGPRRAQGAGDGDRCAASPPRPASGSPPSARRASRPRPASPAPSWPATAPRRLSRSCSSARRPSAKTIVAQATKAREQAESRGRRGARRRSSARSRARSPRRARRSRPRPTAASPPPSSAPPTPRPPPRSRRAPRCGWRPRSSSG